MQDSQQHRIRVIYPAKNGRIVLCTESDWDRNVEAQFVNGCTSEFAIETGQPFFVWPRAATYFSAKFRSSKLLTFILMSAPNYIQWGGGRRYRTEDPVARLRYGGTRAVGVTHFAHGFLRRLQFFWL
jgi:hypothetical protein